MLSRQKIFFENFWNHLTRCEDIYDVLFPLHLATKPFAISPHAIIADNRKRRRYSVSIMGSCYSIFCVILFSTYYVFAVEERNRIRYEETNQITNAIDAYQLYGTVVVMTIAVFLNGLKQNTLIEAIAKVSEIDGMLAHNYIEIAHKTARNYIAVYVYFIQIIFFLLEYMNCSMFLRQIFTLSDMCLLMCYLPLLVNGFVECQFIIYLSLLRQRFSLVNQELKSLESLVLASVKGLNRLVRLRKLHEELCETGRTFNNAFALQILCIFANTFVSFTTHAYYCFDGFLRILLEESNTDAYNTATTGVWTFCKLLQLLSVTVVCTSVTNEAKQATNLIFKINYSATKAISSEVALFSKQIVHWDFKMTAFGFFNLDLTLFYSAIASATAYLVILLQLDIANRQLDNI